MTSRVPPAKIDALGPEGSYRTRRRQTLTDVAGEVVAELSLVPPLYIERTVAALRRAPARPAQEQAALVAKAAGMFASATLADQSVDQYQYAVSRVGGIPISVVRAATRTTAERLAQVAETVECARPAGTVRDWRAPATASGSGVWLRRGEVLAVNAAGNHPGTHSLWPEAFALGYRVAVRPSRRDPYTPRRLIAALRAAGLDDDQAALLPTDHEHAGTLVRSADLSMVYGDDAVVRRYVGDPTVLPQGPGRSKILLTAEADWRRHLGTIIDSIAGNAGTGCVNATAILVEGDPAPLCAELAARLAAFRAYRPEDDRAVLPVQPSGAARAIERHLLRRASGTRAWLGGDGVAEDLGDGSAALRPALHQLDRADAPQAAVELPFPCVWVAPWRRADGVGPLRNSLVLTAFTHDTELIERLVTEPTIGNVHVGDHPTSQMTAGLPHDGYLAEFLMRSKTVIHDPPRSGGLP
ncbi:aldehyde dehydrogenase family protein [Solwaraspora sp. WMMD791]|uniref:aldehyde dehydrogenase family protein n=1 Tax=Solwaraspora sp. WMMD791 TaxID=3016086 RepID=UPI00249A1676|nr:aldehyde dehydrogenase family protein [Solwaraspora sp. WMMD791]WFE26118.1 aldehyde dehydrogenase family protein [Solwaraspora sp. WMMD791]